jgi:Ni/Fe-hydrogenase 1 B-type cytochrome subunit
MAVQQISAPPVVADEEAVLGCSPIYVWELPVRLTHWAIVISIVVLAITGFYIHAPFLVPSEPIEASSQMATVRFWHEIFALVFTLSVAFRFYWGFVGNSFASWRAIIPHNREQLYWGREMAKYYLFLRRDPVPVTGHNFLAGATYTIVSIGMVFQILTGLILGRKKTFTGIIHFQVVDIRTNQFCKLIFIRHKRNPTVHIHFQLRPHFPNIFLSGNFQYPLE